MWKLGIKVRASHAWRNGTVCCERHLQQKKFERPLHGLLLENAVYTSVRTSLLWFSPKTMTQKPSEGQGRPWCISRTTFAIRSELALAPSFVQQIKTWLLQSESWSSAPQSQQRWSPMVDVLQRPIQTLFLTWSNSSLFTCTDTSGTNTATVSARYRLCSARTRLITVNTTKTA